VLRSLSLEPQPSARHTREILVHIGHELAALGARIEYSVVGGLRFRMPPIWRRHRRDIFLAISSGRVTIGADSGEPWRVRYDVRFTVVTWVAFVLMAGVIAAGFHRWSGSRVFNILVLVWGVAYVIPTIAADRAFRWWLALTCREAPRTDPPHRREGNSVG
jgi:hypothetical protein